MFVPKHSQQKHIIFSHENTTTTHTPNQRNCAETTPLNKQFRLPSREFSGPKPTIATKFKLIRKFEKPGQVLKHPSPRHGRPQRATHNGVILITRQ